MAFRPVADPEDWPAVARWLVGAGLAMDLRTAPRQFAGGLANRNYLVRVNGEPAVFRRPPPGPLAHGASDMAREARVLLALHGHFPLSPRCLALGDDATVIGVPFLLLEWRPGVAVGGALPAGPERHADQWPDAHLWRDAHQWMVPAIAGVLASLHALDPVAVGLETLGRPTGFAARQLAGWTRRAAAAFGREAPAALEALLARLEATLPSDPTPARLLHMDPKFDNLLLDPLARAPTALIDWDMATLGPPAFDLAVLLSYWITPEDPPGVHGLAAVPSLAPGWPGRAAVVAAYAEAAGAVPPHLAWHLALARLRLATAWMQLYRLWQQGAARGDRYAGLAGLADAILAQALTQFGEVA